MIVSSAPWCDKTNQTLTLTNNDEAHYHAAVEYGPSGAPLGLGKVVVANAGFQVGMNVKRKDDTNSQIVISCIVGIDDDGVATLANYTKDGGIEHTIVAGASGDMHYKKCYTLSMGDFLDAYAVTQHKIQLLEGYPDNRSVTSGVTVAKYLQSVFETALFRLDHAAITNMPAHRIQAKPHRSVFMEEGVVKGGLIMVPASTRIAELSDDKRAGVQGRLTCAAFRKARFSISPLVSTECVAAYWCVKTVCNPDDKKAREHVDYTEGVSVFGIVSRAIGCQATCETRPCVQDQRPVLRQHQSDQGWRRAHIVSSCSREE